ncbi:hypothetical protein NQZ68_019781 [Dissostichus eleginoides]|nr:hypothetical protein NQZ68_019781 [Dissostichus eleginoides]
MSNTADCYSFNILHKCSNQPPRFLNYFFSTYLLIYEDTPVAGLSELQLGFSPEMPSTGPESWNISKHYGYLIKDYTCSSPPIIGQYGDLKRITQCEKSLTL